MKSMEGAEKKFPQNLSLSNREVEPNFSMNASLPAKLKNVLSVQAQCILLV